MTVGHLLTMTSGLPGMLDGIMKYYEIEHLEDGALKESLLTDTPQAFFARLPQMFRPGRFFNYSPPGTDVLAGIIARAAGMPYEDYARTRLFEPLGIAAYDWARLPDGTAMGAGGLSLRARDMLRFGWLYLNNGRWGEKQVVPAEWVAQSSPRIKLPMGYGRLFWSVPFAPLHGYCANGFLGQFIDIFPKWELVIVRTGTTGPVADAIMRKLGMG